MTERPKPKHNIPADAEKVFSGVIFDVWQWQQQQFDGSYATFEVLRRPDTVLIIPVTETGKILLLDQEQPGKAAFTGVPGGRAEINEDPLAAAKRELEEETAYVSNDWELFKSFQPFSKLDWAIYIFIARNCKASGKQQLDSGERVTLKEVTFEQLIDACAEGTFADIEISLELLRAYKQGTLEQLRKQITGV